MRYKLVLTYLDNTNKTFYIAENSFRARFRYMYVAIGENGNHIYINRQAVRTVVYSEVEE